MSTRASTRIAVIMAGGMGERFWPISRPDRPKQLLPLASGGRTLLADTVRRLYGLVRDEHMLVITGRGLRKPIIASDMPVIAEQVIAEPARRNTLGAVAWAVAWVLGRLGVPADEAVLAIIPADQHVGDLDAFDEDVKLALAAAEQNDALVTIGIPPTRPETGYGYIELAPQGLRLADGSGGGGKLRTVARFYEKPNFKTAVEFLRTGRHLWNAGMFFWRISVFFAELERVAPPIAATIRNIAEALAQGDDREAERRFTELPTISIDYALMERAERVLVVRAGFPWDDLGAWDAWQRVQTGDEAGNVTHGEAVLFDCRECAVYNELGESLPVAVVGLDGIVVAVGSEGILVAPLSRAQEVREVAVEMRRRAGRQTGSRGGGES